MIRSTILILLSSILLTACVPTANITNTPDYSSLSTTEKGSNPELNDTTKTTVGSTIYREFDYKVTPAIKLEKDLNSSQFNFSANSKLMALQENDKTIYTSMNRNLGDYVSDFDVDGKIDHIKAREDILKDWTPLENPVPYKKAESVKTENSEGFEIELLYQGMKQNSITILYREYKDDFARPAYTQKVEYELNKEDTTEIVFKGAKIKVLGASSNDLTYEVLKGFNLDL